MIATTFANNSALIGAAIFTTAPHPNALIRTQFRDVRFENNVGDSVLFLSQIASWTCQPGFYAPPPLVASPAIFTDCSALPCL